MLLVIKLCVITNKSEIVGLQFGSDQIVANRYTTKIKVREEFFYRRILIVIKRKINHILKSAFIE